ncbi:MAG: hypothetical protein II997_09655 [Clostridia bacterium]|nr:hypothetical protein [Clostridia bacterium]
MFIAIIKDSIILFLLIYAIIDLCQHFVHFLSKWLAVESPIWELHFWDATQHPLCGLECALRIAASKQKEPVWVIYNSTETEKYEILTRLCRDYENITLITREECLQMITDETDQVVSSVHNREVTPFPDK